MSVFPLKSVWKRRVSAVLAVIFFTVTILGMSLITGCGVKTQSEGGEDAAFETFTEALFRREVSATTISLHYTLQDPSAFDLGKQEVSLGSFSVDQEGAAAYIENLREALEDFEYKKLSEENQLTYDVLEDYLEVSAMGAPYLLYTEPMNCISGVQSQLPVLLSEFRLNSRDDVETYLGLMKLVPGYFVSLIDFEKAKAEQGLFMSDSMAQMVLDQCRSFLDMGENNYLVSTFAERVKLIEELTLEEQSDYIQQNARCLQEEVLPAYQKLMAEVTVLKGSGTNEKGLCYFPEGKAYYEYVVAQETGSSRSVEELQLLTKRQIIADLEAMEKVLGITPRNAGGENSGTEGGNDTGEESTTAVSASVAASLSLESAGNIVTERVLAQEALDTEATNPSQAAAALEILGRLEGHLQGAFPLPPDTTTRVKYVPEALQKTLSPAFYMIPAIDNATENVIYLNQGYVQDDLTLFTTLAHEGYPGHLYQTIYYASQNPPAIRNLLNFGGYVEGWATYAEMCSYYMTDLSKEQATLLQKNASIILGLYALADMGVHYDGWSQMDMVRFFSGYGITNAESLERLYQLIIGDPGNYLKYYIGYAEFLELKREWVRQQGADYSQEAFHRAVLDVGPAGFDVVEKHIKEEMTLAGTK